MLSPTFPLLREPYPHRAGTVPVHLLTERLRSWQQIRKYMPYRHIALVTRELRLPSECKGLIPCNVEDILREIDLASIALEFLPGQPPFGLKARRR